MVSLQEARELWENCRACKSDRRVTDDCQAPSSRGRKQCHTFTKFDKQ
jgi:hypothetical protein